MGLFVTRATQAQAPQLEAENAEHETLVVDNIVIEDNAIVKPKVDPIPVKPTPKPKTQPSQPVQTNVRSYSKDEVVALINSYSAQYGIKPDAPLCIAKMESGYRYDAKNRSSTASGVFQYLNGTWRGTDEGKAGLSVFDADANVKAAIKYMASRRSTQPWEVRHKCPQVIKL